MEAGFRWINRSSPGRQWEKRIPGRKNRMRNAWKLPPTPKSNAFRGAEVARRPEDRYMHRGGRTNKAAKGQMMKALPATQGKSRAAFEENEASSPVNDRTKVFGSAHFVKEASFHQLRIL